MLGWVPSPYQLLVHASYLRRRKTWILVPALQETSHAALHEACSPELQLPCSVTGPVTSKPICALKLVAMHFRELTVYVSSYLHENS